MGKPQPPPIEQVVEILDEIDEALRELQPEGEGTDTEDPASDGDGG